MSIIIMMIISLLVFNYYGDDVVTRWELVKSEREHLYRFYTKKNDMN